MSESDTLIYVRLAKSQVKKIDDAMKVLGLKNRTEFFRLLVSKLEIRDGKVVILI